LLGEELSAKFIGENGSGARGEVEGKECKLLIHEHYEL